MSVWIGAALVFVLTFTALSLAQSPTGDRARIRDRLNGMDRRMDPLGEVEEPPFRARIVDPFLKAVGENLLRLTPRRQLEGLGGRLQKAGDPLTPGQFTMLRVVLGLIGLIPVVFGGRAILLAVILAVLGVRLPDFWLSRTISRRQRQFGKALPDAMDLLAVSVEAGMGFDQALERVSERIPSPVREEFARTVSEVRMGRARAEALTDLSERMGLPELRQFVSAVVQAETLGVGLARPLRVQADALRLKRRQKAEEAAMKTPIKLLFPLVFLVFPSIFVILLGPALLSFSKILAP